MRDGSRAASERRSHQCLRASNLRGAHARVRAHAAWRRMRCGLRPVQYRAMLRDNVSVNDRAVGTANGVLEPVFRKTGNVWTTTKCHAQ